MQGTFKKDTPFSKRVELSKRICTQHPDRIPIILETTHNCNLKLNRTKYLVPKDITIGQFLSIIREQSNIHQHKALFLFCGNNSVLVPITNTINEVYDKYSDDDKCLYMTAATENATDTYYNNVSYYTTGILDNILYGCSRITRTLGF